jgi:hypothetical protein
MKLAPLASQLIVAYIVLSTTNNIECVQKIRYVYFILKFIYLGLNLGLKILFNTSITVARAIEQLNSTGSSLLQL